MVKPSMNPIHSNTRNRELLDHLLGHLAASLVRVLVFVVVRWKTVEVVDQIRLLGDIDCHRAWAMLPVSREDDHGLWLHFGRDLPPGFAQFGKGRMVFGFHEVRPANTEEVDRHPWGGLGVRGGFRHGACCWCGWWCYGVGLPDARLRSAVDGLYGEDPKENETPEVFPVEEGTVVWWRRGHDELYSHFHPRTFRVLSNSRSAHRVAGSTRAHDDVRIWIIPARVTR